MPVYLLHGFRWPRSDIRIYIVMNDLEDAAAEWTVGPTTTQLLRESLTERFPSAMQHLPNLRFIEQYDPDDEATASSPQPYAYVADVVHQVKLGADVDELRQGINADQWDALLELRDKLASDAKVGWYIVYCGDEERRVEDDESEDEYTALPPLPDSAKSQQKAWADTQTQRQQPSPTMRTLSTSSQRSPSATQRDSAPSPASSRKSQSISTSGQPPREGEGTSSLRKLFAGMGKFK